MLSLTIPSINPSQNTPVLPNIRRIVMRPSGASCSRRNSAKLSLATIHNPQRPAARTRSLSRRHRAAHRATPQARKAWAEAVRTGKLIKNAIADSVNEFQHCHRNCKNGRFWVSSLSRWRAGENESENCYIIVMPINLP